MNKSRCKKYTAIEKHKLVSKSNQNSKRKTKCFVLNKPHQQRKGNGKSFVVKL